jgi:hypothetical protein
VLIGAGAYAGGPVLPDPIAPGSLPGQFSVAPNGGAIYRVPIKAAPSPLAPSLELVYTGRGSGTAGVGWSLRGIPVITRCPATTAQDGARGAVRFNANDRFCLDGQRLILVSGTYGGDGAEYRTEQDSFSKIVSYQALGSGPRYFTVWTKTGQIMTFGQTNNSQIPLVAPAGGTQTWVTGTLREWALDGITDSRNRTLNVHYANQNVTTLGSYAPDEIDYGGGLSVFIDYGTPTNAITRYLGGAMVKPSKQIQGIKIRSATTGGFLYTYATFSSVGPQQAARISSLKLCDLQTQQTCLPAVNFGYDNNGNSPGGFTSTPANWALPSGAVSPVVGTQTQQQVFTYNDTVQYGTPSSPVSRTQTHISLVDLNGDGLPDLYVTAYQPASGTSPEVIYPGVAYLNTGTSFSSTATPWPLPAGAKAQKDAVAGQTITALIDVNGDGLPDLYQTVGSLGAGTPAGVVYLNTGSGFSSTPTSWSLPSAIAAQSQNVILTTTSNVGLPTSTADTKAALIDIDGDGLPDAYRTDSTSQVYLGTSSGFANTAAAGWTLPGGVTTQHREVSFGDNFQYGTTTTPLPRTQTQIALVDLNGDGLPDLYVTPYTPPSSPGGAGTVTPGYVYFNTGTGFLTTSTAWPLPTGVKAQKDVVNGQTVVTLVDVNGDGLPDLLVTEGPLVAGNPRGTVYLNTGNGFATTETPWSLPSLLAGSTVVGPDGATQSSLIDIDGDGLPDALVTTSTNPGQVYAGTNAAQARLTSITSAAMAGINISYSKLTDPTVYTVDSGANAAVYPQVDIASAKTVVASVSTDNGIGGSRVNTYTYGGLKSELGFGRGNIGFRWMDVKDASTGIESYVEYRQDYPFVGLVSKSETRLSGSGNGGVLRRTTNTWSCQMPRTLSACTVAAGNTYFPYLASSLDETWDLNGAAFPSITTTSTFGQSPQYGAPTQISVTNNGDGSNKTTVYTYAPADTTKWLLNRVSRSTVTTSTP